MSLREPDGTVAVGPKGNRGFPIAVGADRVLYAVSCLRANPPENRLYAYSTQLEELWHLDLGKDSYCPGLSSVLDEQGVLYLVIAPEQGLGHDVVAIQTKSPGVAPTAWPMIRHDVRGTMWLTDPNR